MPTAMATTTMAGATTTAMAMRATLTTVAPVLVGRRATGQTLSAPAEIRIGVGERAVVRRRRRGAGRDGWVAWGGPT